MEMEAINKPLIVSGDSAFEWFFIDSCFSLAVFAIFFCPFPGWQRGVFVYVIKLVQFALIKEHLEE